MPAPDLSRDGPRRLSATAGELLAVARPRIERQAQYAALIAKGGRRARAAADWLDRAGLCVTALAQPVAVRIPLAVRATEGGVEIAGTVAIGDPTIAADVAAGGRLTACLVTLGYGQEAAFDWLGRDYALHHVQTDLAREALFALARAADRAERARTPGGRLRRIPVRTHGPCGQKELWDPARVQALLAAFGAANPGVGLTDSGFFAPLHSLLALTLIRAGGPQGRLP